MRRSQAVTFVAAAAALALALGAGVALAQPQAAGLKTYTDPQGRFSFQHPANITPDVDARPNQPLSILVGVADYECSVFAVSRPESEGKDGDVIRRSYSAPIAADKWKASMDGFQLYSRKGAVQSTAVDTSKFWPVQTAQITTDENKPAIAALQARPGVEVWEFCTAYDGKDHSAFFNQVISTFSGPHDAELQAQAETLAAQRDAAQQAQAAAAAAAEEAAKKKKK